MLSSGNKETNKNTSNVDNSLACTVLSKKMKSETAVWDISKIRPIRGEKKHMTMDFRETVHFYGVNRTSGNTYTSN